eukprot:m.8284 g.8284  ORF g.8284 m.8284 type:complete len:134 (+) comp6067_c0_seq1:839-1240(+)
MTLSSTRTLDQARTMLDNLAGSRQQPFDMRQRQQLCFLPPSTHGQVVSRQRDTFFTLNKFTSDTRIHTQHNNILSVELQSTLEVNYRLFMHSFATVVITKNTARFRPIFIHFHDIMCKLAELRLLVLLHIENV